MHVTFDRAICAVMDAEACVARALFVSKEVLTSRFLLTLHLRLVSFRDMLRVTHFDEDYNTGQTTECFDLVVRCYQVGLTKSIHLDPFTLKKWAELNQQLADFCMHMETSVHWSARKPVLSL